MTRGWKTWGFWLSSLSMVIAGVLATGAITNNSILEALGGIQASLTSIGYGWTRSAAKKGAMLVSGDPNAAPVHRSTTEHFIYIVSMLVQFIPFFGGGAGGLFGGIQAAITALGFSMSRDSLLTTHDNLVAATSEKESIRTQIQ